MHVPIFMGVSQPEVLADEEDRVGGRMIRKFGMERAMGIEPTSKAWEALILPLNYARPEGRVAWDLGRGQWGRQEKRRERK